MPSQRTPIRYLPQTGLSTEKPVLQGFFLWLSPFFPCGVRGVHISHTITGDFSSHDQQSTLWVEGIHNEVCCPKPQRDRLPHCCHHLSAMQPSARCLTPWLRWIRALFVVLGRCPLRGEDDKGWVLEGCGSVSPLPNTPLRIGAHVQGRL
jgi:hypothetical protein